MTTKEKYINYIVDDLIKDTRIDYDEEKISFPFLFHSSLPFSPLSLFFSSPFSFFSPFSFSKYIKQRYGAKDEETHNIWHLYKEKMITLIKK